MANIKLDAAMSHGGYKNSTDYKDRMLSSYQSKINNKFDQSTSVRVIQEEFPYGSGEFRDLLCRVTSVRTVGTGSKMSDSYKTIIFEDQQYPKSVGYLYQFENNYWIACNSDIMSSPTDSIVVRRCNNVLKWKDDNGNIQSVPISFDEDAFYVNNSIKQDTDMLSGYRRAIIQRTPLTQTLKPNQRFIFGTQCLKISGSGIGDFLNQQTENDSSASIIRLNFEYDYPNIYIDDMENKIANVYSEEYTISIDQIGNTYSTLESPYTFTATVLKNNEIVEKGLKWRVKGIGCTYTQEDNKLNVSFQTEGAYTIIVSASDNGSISTSIDISVVSIDNYSIRCLQPASIIYKGDTEIFEFKLYKNATEILDAEFLFEKIDKLSSVYYTYEISNNKLSITNNKMNSSTKVEIDCSSSNYPSIAPYKFMVELGGSW